MKVDNRTVELANSYRGPIQINAEDIANISSLAEVKAGNADIKDIPFVLDENKTELASLISLHRDSKFDLKDSKEKRAYGELLRNAFSGDERGQDFVDLCNYMKFVINSDILASPWALSAFQVINLKPDELPLIEFPRTANFQHFGVKSVSLDGGTERDQWRETRDILQIDMEMVGTPRVEFSTRNLQIGDINAGKEVENKLKLDLDLHVDGLAKLNIDAAGVQNGLRDSLNLHPNIIPANIPDANMLDLTGSNPGVLTLDKLKQIIAHIQRFGFAGQVDETFQLKSMHISPQNLQDPWDYIDLVSGWDYTGTDPTQTLPKHTVPSSVRDSIFNTGMITNAWGTKFSWVPNVQLAKGWLYCFTNKPLGWMFRKPQMDSFYIWDARTNPEYAINENGEVMAKRAVKYVTPDLWRQRILIVHF